MLKTKTSTNGRKKTKCQLGQVALLCVLMSVILSLSIQAGIQASYGSSSSSNSSSEQQVRTLRIKANVEKNIVAQAGTQVIRFQVADEKSHQPIGGAITAATVKYADGKSVRQFSAPTDTSGRSSFSWQLERNAPLGSYAVVYSVSETGYVSQLFDSWFSVVAHGMTINKSTPSYYYGSSSLSIAGSPVHIERSIHIEQFYN